MMMAAVAMAVASVPMNLVVPMKPVQQQAGYKLGDRVELADKPGKWQVIEVTASKIRFQKVSADGSRLLPGKTTSIDHPQKLAA